MLTPEGMRMRYINGQKNREKYIEGFNNEREDLKVLDPDYLQS